MSIKVLYIMGFSRSGSTLLDTALSDPPGAFGTGELTNLIRAMDKSGNYCACGEPSGLCPLWREVRREWARVEGDGVALEYPILQSQVERIRDFARHRRRDGFDDGVLNKYLAQSRALFGAIAKASGATTIVDSSKAPVRALALSGMKDVDFRVIHLVRDVRGVVCSLRKPYEKDPAGGVITAQRGFKPSVAVSRWWLTNVAANRVRALLGERATLVRYEDLVTQPLTTLEHLSVFAGIDWRPTARKLAEGGAFVAGHMIEGNRLRMQKQIRLKPDVRWRDELPTLQKRLLPLLTAPVSRRYGYR